MNFTFLRIPIMQKNNCSGIFSLCQTRSVRVTPLTNETGVSCAAPGQCPSPDTRRARHNISMHRPSVVDRLSREPHAPPECTFIVVVGPHAQTREGRGCRPHGLWWLYVSICNPAFLLRTLVCALTKASRIKSYLGP